MKIIEQAEILLSLRDIDVFRKSFEGAMQMDDADKARLIDSIRACYVKNDIAIDYKDILNVIFAGDEGKKAYETARLYFETRRDFRERLSLLEELFEFCRTRDEKTWVLQNRLVCHMGLADMEALDKTYKEMKAVLEEPAAVQL